MKMPTAAASEITSRRQPKASSSGSIITDSDERRPAAISRDRKITRDHHEGVALAERSGLSYCHVTHRYVSMWAAMYVPVSNIVKRANAMKSATPHAHC